MGRLSFVRGHCYISLQLCMGATLCAFITCRGIFQRCYDGSDRIDGGVERTGTAGGCRHLHAREFTDSIGAIEGEAEGWWWIWQGSWTPLRENACGSKTLSANLTKKDGTEGENMKANYTINCHINWEIISPSCWRNILQAGMWLF